MSSRKAGDLLTTSDITPEELQLAVRNHSMPLEALRYDVTPLGLHYLLIHFDIPSLDPVRYELHIAGHVRKPLSLTLDDLMSRPATTLAVTLECAGNGRALLSPRPLSQPWLGEAVGNAEWTGTPLRAVLDEAGMRDGAVDVVFTGHDRGVQGEVEQLYERSLSVADATREEVLLAYAINGRPLTPQHGSPLRLIVPGWYGMTHVKWLRSVTVIDHEFQGYQQTTAYHFRTKDGEAGEPVQRMRPRALMVPPGHPDFMSRTRFLEPSVQLVEGRAWSGHGPIAGVDFSDDGGRTWSAAVVEKAGGPYAWHRWTHRWDATRPGEHELCVRGTDTLGNVQPVDPNWNLEGVENNAVQRVRVIVGEATRKQPPADSL
ncbi:MAG TPA: sulfite oxidase [Candidatus Dormibacteraeota bacterium]|nr:sulfite oxidase [Candidatus Dormibacteraeota bacterium]